MTGRRTATLRFRVTALATLAVLVVLVAAATALVLAQRATLTDQLDESLADRAAAAAAQAARGESVELSSEDVTVRVLPDGRDGGRSAARDGTMPGGGPARIVSRSVDGGTVVVTGSLEDVVDSTRALGGALLLAVPATTAVLAGLVWLLAGRVLRPVDRIRAEVDRITAGRLDRRVPQPAGGDEIARLARTMNAMLDRLADGAERQRRFVADAAHELRTPLARIRTQVEVDQAHPGTADPAATAASLSAETARLERLVDDLLLLARSDAGAAALRDAGPVDLDEVVLGQVQRLRGPGRPRLDADGVDPVQVAGDHRQLERAVANLLDNALRHARDRVTVSVGSQDGLAVLTVADDGPGIPPEARESVFERFTRLDDARSADGGGAGLGLAIARDIAERHGGRLVLAGDAVGARFVLALPLFQDVFGR